MGLVNLGLILFLRILELDILFEHLPVHDNHIPSCRLLQARSPLHQITHFKLLDEETPFR